MWSPEMKKPYFFNRESATGVLVIPCEAQQPVFAHLAGRPCAGGIAVPPPATAYVHVRGTALLSQAAQQLRSTHRMPVDLGVGVACRCSRQHLNRKCAAPGQKLLAPAMPPMPAALPA